MAHAAARPIQALTDDQLMEQLDGGDADAALSELIDRHGARIHRVVHAMLRDAHLAQDATQEVFAKVFTKSHLYVPQSSFRAWLYEIARNQALSTLRNQRHAPRPMSTVGPDVDSDPLEALAVSPDARVPEEREFRAAFHRAVAELPENYQYVFRLCVLRGMPYREAAGELDLPVGTVAIRLMRARQRLFATLSPHFDRLRRPPACLQSA